MRGWADFDIRGQSDTATTTCTAVLHFHVTQVTGNPHLLLYYVPHVDPANNMISSLYDSLYASSCYQVGYYAIVDTGWQSIILPASTN
jgi:hypothetical protein